jgi:hypothetical protein
LTFISTIETKKIVKSFATDLLKSGFNEFFRNIWEAICAQNESTHMRGIRPIDERNFLLLGSFALEFNRCLHVQHERIRRHQQTRGRDDNIEGVEDSASRFDISYISLVLQPEILGIVLDEYIVRYPLKKQWSNLAYVVSFLKELMLTLDLMLKSGVSDLSVIASRVLHRILYDSRHCDSIVRLVRAYRPQFNSRLYLANLFELIDVFIRIIQENDQIETFHTKKRQTNRKSKKKTSGEDEDMDDTEEAARRSLVQDFEGEKRFNLDQFKHKFANSFVMRQYFFLFRFYASNSTTTNGHILNMMKMIADECKAGPLLYQLSLFKTINDILSDPVLSLTEETNRELVHFSRKLVRDFMEACNNNHKFMPAEFIFLKGGSFMDSYGSEDAARSLADEGDDVYAAPRKSTKGRKRKRRDESDEEEENIPVQQPSEDEEEEQERVVLTPPKDALNEDGEEEYIFDETQEEPQEETQEEEEETQEAPAVSATPVRSRSKKTNKRRRKQ